MKKALINPNQTATYISSWELINGRYEPIYNDYIDSQVVCDVSASEFPVAEPLFWLDCEDDVISYEYYYDTQSSTIKAVINAPYPIDPEKDQPITSGLQDL